MGLVKKILFGFAVLCGLLFVIGLFLPSQWEVKRSTTIAAPASAIYPMVADMKNGWTQWSAFDLEDKEITYSYSGPEQGEGAEREWKSEKMGNGNMKITKADPAKGIEYTLLITDTNFLLKGTMEFEPQGEATKVTWSGNGDVGNNVIFKYMVAMMDKMMGPMYEKSLETLKTKVESSTTK